MFITFEGGEGGGKSTQVSLLKEYLTQMGLNIIATREPGGTPFGEKIRDLIFSTEGLSGITETLLFNAARSELVANVIKPALAEDKIVICDRYIDSTYAYQGFGRSVMGLIEVSHFGAHFVGPDMIFVLDIDPVIGLKRKGVDDLTRFDKEDLDFHNRVREGFLALAKHDSTGRHYVIDASQSAKVVHEKIVATVEEYIGIRRE